jgi:hypothetical protein
VFGKGMSYGEGVGREQKGGAGRGTEEEGEGGGAPETQGLLTRPPKGLLAHIEGLIAVLCALEVLAETVEGLGGARGEGIGGGGGGEGRGT